MEVESHLSLARGREASSFTLHAKQDLKHSKLCVDIVLKTLTVATIPANPGISMLSHRLRSKPRHERAFKYMVHLTLCCIRHQAATSHHEERESPERMQEQGGSQENSLFARFSWWPMPRSWCCFAALVLFIQHLHTSHQCWAPFFHAACNEQGTARAGFWLLLRHGQTIWLHVISRFGTLEARHGMTQSELIFPSPV